MINQRQKWLILGAAGVFVALLFFWILWLFQPHKDPSDATLTIEVAPKDSQLVLNGKKIKAGKRVIVAPAELTISATHKGFAEQTRKVSLGAGEEKYVGISLESNSKETENWYKDHPRDDDLSSKIYGEGFSQNSQDMVSKVPIVTLLPYLAEGLDFRVDYGQDEKFDAASPADITYILVTARLPEARQAAIDWMKSQGYDPSDMDVRFNDFENPLEAPGEAQ